MSDRRQAYRDDRRRDRDGDRRHRSRSPHHRRDNREVNSYESSRNYREREREQRYQGGGGGGGGGGGDHRRDYDRGSSRRDARRDDGYGRRDDRRGDLFDNHRRRDDRRDQDKAQDRDDERQMERQTRQKSASPARKPKEPTPDLTDVVSVLKKPRRMTQWDIKPPGYENVTAEQAKLSGMFLLPGAPGRAQPMDQSRLQAFMSQPQNQVSQNALKASTSRQSKRLTVGNLSQSATNISLADFFNLQLNGLNVTKGKDPCLSAAISPDQASALVEFKTPEDATNAMTLNGQSMDYDAMDTNGTSNGTAKGLQISRPQDYIVPIVTDPAQNEFGILSRNVPDSQNKISVNHIPTFLTEEQVQELLQSFGELRSFALAKDTASDQSRGFGFCEYMDGNVTATAIEALHNMELGDSHLQVHKACTGTQQASGEMGVTAMALLARAEEGQVKDVGRVICLLNMITSEELMDSVEADEILEDVKEECQRYGEILEIKMPRPTVGARSTNGIGKIFIKYANPESAQATIQSLTGRKFADRTVVATLFNESYFDSEAW